MGLVGQRLGTMLAAMGLGIVLTTGQALAAPAPAPSVKSDAALESTMSAGQVVQFRKLPASKRAEMVSLFSDSAAMSGKLTKAQIKVKYPDATVTDDRSTVRSASTGTRSVNSVHPMYTVYNVHSHYNHTVSILWTSNTATLDYYYQTGNNRVLNEQKCTWVDYGAYYGASIDSVSTNMYLSGGNGHCDATVNLSAFKIAWSGYLNQNMSVNYYGIYDTYFYQNGP